MPKGLMIVLIVLFFSSCYSPRYVYSPATQNIPLLCKKNDIKVGGYIATGLNSNDLALYNNASNFGIDLHGAYAFTNHFAGMINYYNRWERNGGDNDVVAGDSITVKYKRNLVEFGGGYFSALENENSSFQLFAGMAFGKFQINESNAQNRISASRFHNSNITKVFIQPAIISGVHKRFTASFSLRFTMVYYNHISTDYSSSELKTYFLTDLSSSPVFFWEPAMDYVFGFKRFPGVKLDMQTGFSVLINRRFVDYRTINLSLGVTSDLHFKRIPGKSNTAKPGASNQN